ncbi:MAG: choice-of-anchor Q domain-containing protein, partial [Thermotogota bacterium]
QQANTTFTVKNCTIHDNPQRRSYSMYSQYNDPTPLNLTIINCTFSDSYGMAYFGEHVDLTIKHSNFYAPNRNSQIIYKGVEYTAKDLEDCFFGEGILSTDPQFIKSVWGEKGGNYHLKPKSLLIDGGTSENTPSDDLESTLRPQGSQVDIGAYEQ